MAMGRYLKPPFTICRFSGSYRVVGARLNIETRKSGLPSGAREPKDELADAEMLVSR